MTIDTEGSEPDIVKDFPWNDFDVRVVQIEQLLESKLLFFSSGKEASNCRTLAEFRISITF